MEELLKDASVIGFIRYELVGMMNPDGWRIRDNDLECDVTEGGQPVFFKDVLDAYRYAKTLPDFP